MNPCSHPQPQATIHLLSIDLPFLDISNAWNQVVCGLLIWLWSYFLITILKSLKCLSSLSTGFKILMVRAPGRPSLTSWDVVFWAFHDLGALGHMDLSNKCWRNCIGECTLRKASSPLGNSLKVGLTSSNIDLYLSRSAKFPFILLGFVCLFVFQFF